MRQWIRVVAAASLLAFRRVQPGDDFYRYAVGGRIASGPFIG
jgi:hypothetical protein